LSTFTGLPSTIFGLYFNLAAALTEELLKIEQSLMTTSGSFISPHLPSTTIAPSAVPCSVIVKLIIAKPSVPLY